MSMMGQLFALDEYDPGVDTITGQPQQFGLYDDKALDSLAAIAQSVPAGRVKSIMESIDRAPWGNIEDRRTYDPTMTPNEVVDQNTPYPWEWAAVRARTR